MGTHLTRCPELIELFCLYAQQLIVYQWRKVKSPKTHAIVGMFQLTMYFQVFVIACFYGLLD
ncbi:hypothetical protein VCR4J2_40015 [Vibrio coralliirubri]|nr:hypothetical protein VCR4J2_40015 [Vibrio coralliirubri]